MSESKYWTESRRPRISRRRFLRSSVVGGMGAASVMLIGCDGSDTSSTRQQPRAVAGEPKRGGRLVVGYDADPTHLDFQTTNTYGTWIKPLMLAYNGLLKHEEPDEFGRFEIMPDLAESLPEQPDQLTYIFKLRPGIRWHDVPPVNGRELTAHDIVYSFERLTSDGPNFLSRSLYADVDRWEAVDNRTVRMIMKRPWFAVLMQIANPLSVIVNREVVERDGNIENTAIGTGPFILQEWQRSSHFRFVKNPQYFEDGLPYLDEVHVPIIQDTAARVASLRSGEIDIDDAVPPSQVSVIQRSNPDIEVVRYPGTVHWFSATNLRSPKLADKRVRKAIQLAVDYQSYIDVLADGEGKRNPMLIWWQKPYVFPEEEAPQTDQDEAKRLLTEAGYADGLDLTATVTGPTGPGTMTQFFEIIQSDLEKVGIRLHIEPVEPSAFSKKVFVDRNYEMYGAAAPAHEDPDKLWLVFFYGGASQNATGYDNPRVNELLDKQKAAGSADERAEIYWEIQRAVKDDPMQNFYFTPYNFSAAQPRVKNWRPMTSLGSPYRRLSQVWVES